MIHPTLPFLAILLTACATQQPTQPPHLPPNPQTNLLKNNSFESPAQDPWYDFSIKSKSWLPFTISNSVAHTGSNAAHLHMDSADQQPQTTAIHGVVQTITTKDKSLPAYISGHYKVTSWTRSTKNQYLQLVFMAAKPSNKPTSTNYPTYQLAIPLAGITEPPFNMGNRKFAFNDSSLPPQEPPQDHWVFFEYNLKDLYQEHWNFIPENSTEFHAFFEVRYDNRDPESDQPATAEVYFDTLYIGPDSRTPTPTPAD